MTDPEDDWYDSVPGKSMYGLNDAASRYMYPPPPRVKQPKPWRGWMRMTNLAGAFADQRALQLWLEWKVMMGLRLDDGLIFDEWMTQHVEDLSVDKQKALASEYAEKARAAAGGNVAARKGTARHDMLEGYLKAGQVNGTRTMRVQMDSLLTALEAHQLDPIPGWSERRVWHPAAGGTMGTLDMGVSCRLTGRRGILDLKTQGRFYTFQEIAAQQYGYDSAPWVWDGPDNDTGRWVPNEFWDLQGLPEGEFADRRVALLAHMPLDMSPVRIIEVPLDYGQEVLECAAENVRLRSIGKSVAPGRRVGAERPLLTRTIVR